MENAPAVEVAAVQDSAATGSAVATDEAKPVSGFERKWFFGKDVRQTPHPVLKPKGGEKIIFTWNSIEKSSKFLSIN